MQKPSFQVANVCDYTAMIRLMGKDELSMGSSFPPHTTGEGAVQFFGLGPTHLLIYPKIK